jgi:iron complex transport system ATP-binding protein
VSARETRAVLSARGLHVGYDKKVVVRDIGLSALPGQVICVIGPNGAGKSTILRTLAGLLPPVEGEVCLGGESIASVKPAVKAKEIAVVLTEKIVVPMTSAFEIVAMGRMPHTGFFGTLSSDDRRVVETCLELAGAGDLAQRNFQSLSDGEKQKVMIARALAQEPRLIILDEPTSHLDIKHKVEVIRILNLLARDKGLTVILSMHDIDLALKSCQIMLLVKDGEVAACGKPEDIIRKNTIGKLYDIKGASYDHLLGSIELCNERLPEVFVVAGAGTGALVYRMLSRMGFGIATGILHRNDIDYSVAVGMKLTVLAAESFEPITATDEAFALAKSARIIVDSGFPVGTFNQENIGLLRRLATEGRRVLSLRPAAEVVALYGKEAPAITALPCVSALQEAMSSGQS